MDICFNNIRVISPSQNLDKVLNLHIKDGVIVHLSDEKPVTNANTEIIDGSNLVCSPGLFDMHVHLREPGQEYKEDIQTGTAAAANGCFTGVLCMPNTAPPIDNPAVVELINKKAQGNLVDVEIAAAITHGREGKHISTMLELNDYGVKLFTDDGSSVTNSEVMKRAFDYAATKNLLISQHCEDHGLTVDFSANEGVVSSKLGLKGYPSVAEEIIVMRDVMLAEYCGNRGYHASHISTKGSVRILREAKARGLKVSCEVTPHHFTLTDDLLVSYDTNLKMNPPLRTQDDINAIFEGLKDGTIDCIATDHAPHALHEKEVEYEKAPNGIIGLETSLGVTLTYLYHKGILSLAEIISKMSVNPRKILKMNTINIAVNEIANLSIFAPEEEWTVDKRIFKSKSKNTPYDGFQFKGKPKYSVNNNKLVKCVL